MLEIYFHFWQIRIWNFFFHLWKFQISNLIIVFNYCDCWADICLDSTNYLTMTLVSQHNIYINCKRTNGTTVLKSTDHDSMSGEHVGTTFGMIITSGKLEILPLVALENQGLRKVVKIPKGGKRPGKKWINSICKEARRCQVCWERIGSSLAVMSTTEKV